MSTARKIARNTGLLMAATFFTNIMAIVWTVYSARYLGTSGFGLLSAALALTGLFSVVMDLGLITYTTREVARDKTKTSKFLGNFALIKCILSAIALILLYAYLVINNYPPLAVELTMLIGVYFMLTSFTNLFYSIYVAHEKMEYQAVGNILNSALLLGAILMVISLKADIISFGIAYVVTGMVTLIYAISISFWKFSPPKLEMDWAFWKESIKTALPFGVTGIFTTIYFWIDTVMLQSMQGDVSVGLYNAAYKLILVLLSVYNVYMIVLFPVMAKFFTHSSDSLRFTFQRSFKYLIIITLPIAVGTTMLAKDIILLVYGNEFLPAVIALQILIWSIVFMFMNGLSSNLLGSSDKQLVVTKVTAIGAVFNIGVNLAVIPILSFVGASLATVFTEILIMILLAHIISRTDYAIGKDLLTNLWRILIPNLIILIILAYLEVPLILMVVICTIVYFICIFLTKALDKDDIMIMKSVIRKN